MISSKEHYENIQMEMLQTISDVENGEINHLDAFLNMRQHKESAEQILQAVKTFEENNLTRISELADANQNKYMGFEIKEISGRKTYSFKGIEEIEDAEKHKKQLEEKYKFAHEGIVKGTVKGEYEDGHLIGWYDTEGVLCPIPDLNISKGYISIKKQK